MAGAVPAQEGFVARNLVRAGVHQRLEVDFHRFGGEGGAEVGFEIGADLCVLLHAGFKEAGAAAALGFRAIEREFGGFHEFGGVEAILGRDGHADAAAGEDFLAAEIDGREQGIDDMVGYLPGFVDEYIGLQHGELITTQSGEEGVAADAIAQAFGDDFQIGVAGRVTLRIVERLEVVEVDDEEGKAFAGGAGGFLRVLQLAHQHGAVGEVGQRIVFGDVGNAGFGVAGARHVGADAAPATIGGWLAAGGPPGFAAADGDAEHFVLERFAIAQKIIEAMDRLRRE